MSKGWGKWMKNIRGSTFQLSEEDIVVFVVGPSGSGKSTFVRAVTQACGYVEVGQSLRVSARKVQAIRCELTDAAQKALGAEEQRNIVFVDVPSFHIDAEESRNAEKEMSSWLEKSRSRRPCNRFGTIYLHRIEMDPEADDQYHVQKQLDTFAGTFPQDYTSHAFPQRLHCVFSCMDDVEGDKATKHKEELRKQLVGLRPKVMDWGGLVWNTSIHPDSFTHGDPDTAWQAVKKLFSTMSWGVLGDKLSEQPQLAEVLAQHRHTTKRSSNVILFGEAGVGKSSVINLIAGKDVANTSPNSWGCTLESKQYAFEVAEKTFNIWDTVGLGEPIFSVSNCLGAIEKTYALIKQVEGKGGLDLLLFCMRGGRVTASMLCNYRLFFDVLCQKQIPIAAIVTHLEDEEEMEEWWDRNEKYLSESGMRFCGHVCVTAKRGHPKAVVGRSALVSLLLGHDREGHYPMPPASAWFSGFLGRLSIIPRAKELKDKRDDLERTLRKCCNMGIADAQQLANIIIGPGEWQD